MRIQKTNKIKQMNSHNNMHVQAHHSMHTGLLGTPYTLATKHEQTTLSVHAICSLIQIRCSKLHKEQQAWLCLKFEFRKRAAQAPTIHAASKLSPGDYTTLPSPGHKTNSHDSLTTILVDVHPTNMWCPGRHTHHLALAARMILHSSSSHQGLDACPHLLGRCQMESGGTTLQELAGPSLPFCSSAYPIHIEDHLCPSSPWLRQGLAWAQKTIMKNAATSKHNLQCGLMQIHMLSLCMFFAPAIQSKTHCKHVQ